MQQVKCDKCSLISDERPLITFIKFFVFCNFRCCVDNVDNDDNSHGNDDSNDDHTGRRMKGDTNYIEAKLFTP